MRAMGGAEAVLEEGHRAFAEGDYRWVAELMSHAVFADPSNLQARELEARALEQLAYGAESAPWRNFFLMGARELREGVCEGGNTPSKEMVALLSTEQLFDVLAIRIDGPRAGELRLSFNWIFTDTDERHVLMLSNGVLIHSANRQDPQADATVLVERAALNELFAGITPMASCSKRDACASRATPPSSGSCSACWTSPTPRLRSSRHSRGSSRQGDISAAGAPASHLSSETTVAQLSTSRLLPRSRTPSAASWNALSNACAMSSAPSCTRSGSMARARGETPHPESDIDLMPQGRLRRQQTARIDTLSNAGGGIQGRGAPPSR